MLNVKNVISAITPKKSLKVKYVSRKSKNIYDGEMKANYLQCHVPAKVSRKT